MQQQVECTIKQTSDNNNKIQMQSEQMHKRSSVSGLCPVLPVKPYSLTLMAVTAFASRSHQTLRSDGQDAPTRAPGPDGEQREVDRRAIDVHLVSGSIRTAASAASSTADNLSHALGSREDPNSGCTLVLALALVFVRLVLDLLPEQKARRG